MMFPFCLDDAQTLLALEAVTRIHQEEILQVSAMLQAPMDREWAENLRYHRDRRNVSHEVMEILKEGLPDAEPEG
jgi:hypothetical protein